MVNTLIEKNQTYGIYTTKCNQHEITGNSQKSNNVPLLYDHFDNKNNFDDYDEYGYPFDGWEKPYTDYKYNKVCGIDISHIWSP